MTVLHTNKRRIAIWFIVGIGVAFLITISAGGILLRRGVTFDQISIGKLVAYDCSLLWGNKLELDIETIVVDVKEQGATTVSDVDFVKRGVSVARNFVRFFAKFNIHTLKIGDKRLKITFVQEKKQTYSLNLTTQDSIFLSQLKSDSGHLILDIKKADSKRFNSQLTGQIRLEDGSDTAVGDISAVINDSFPVVLKFTVDSKQISFEGKEGGEIKTIKPLVDLFGLSHNIQRWITDYLSGSRYYLKSFKGQFPWDTPKTILNTLEAEVRVDDTEYTFAPGLEPIKGKYTDVFFKEGVLDIKPFGTTFYGQDGGSSWLDINFNDPANILLTAYIKTRAIANDNILTLLNYYKIEVPFKQVGGKTETDLRLAINLNNQKIGAEGVFEIGEGVFEIGEKNYNVKDARIRLLNSDITIEHLNLGYEDILMAQISGTIQAKKKTGDLDIILEQLALKFSNSTLSLDASSTPQIDYHFDPEGHVLDAQASSWAFDSLKLNLGSFRAPVSMEDLSLELPLTQLDVPPGVISEISGSFSIKNKQADFRCNLLKYNVKGLELMSPPVAVDIGYDNGLFVRNEEPAKWNVSKTPLTLYPSKFKYDDDVFKVEKSRIRYGSFFDSHITGYYNRQSNQGSFFLKQRDITNESLEKGIEIGDQVDVTVSAVGGKYVVNSPVFNLEINTDNEKNWSAGIVDISAFYSHSEILQKYNIKEGSLVISSVNGQRPYTFSADIAAPYPLIVEIDKPVEQFHITGQLTDHGVSATVNEDLDIQYNNNQLAITSENLGYNIPALISMIKDRPKATNNDSDNGKDNHIEVSLKAEKSNLYFSPKSRALADSIELSFVDGELEMLVAYGSGRIVTHLEGETFLVDGKALNDIFMEAFIPGTNFREGEMAIAAKGDFSDFSVVFEIRDTVLEDMKMVNNIMSFVNTLPALVNFSLPQYSLTGLSVTSAVVGMKVKDKLATVESLEVLSPEIQAAGVGWIDFAKRILDLDIYLTTQAGRNLGSIPVVGYVVAGEEDKPSVTLKVEGDLSDPDVKNSAAKEVLAMPFEMLFRSLKLPLHLLNKANNNTQKKE